MKTRILTALVVIWGVLALTPVMAAEDEAEEALPEVIYPQLPKQGKTISDFTPEGWKVEYKVEGDLNGDKQNDTVLVLLNEDPKIAEAKSEEQSYTTFPRILAVVFKEKDGYCLAVQDQSFIPRRDMPNVVDYLADDGVTIKNGTLKIELGVFMTMGGWTTSQYHYTFRWQDNGFYLIGYDASSATRNSGDTTRDSYNLLTRRYTKHQGNFSYGKDKLVKSGRLKKQPLLKLESIGNGLEYSPETAEEK